MQQRQKLAIEGKYFPCVLYDNRPCGEELVVDRPITTLFMLMSADGKINTGATDEFDVDRDFPKIPGVMEGLNQYYRF